jgi:glutamate 5-kinase
MQPHKSAALRDVRHVRRVVVKIGTSTLTKANGDVDGGWVRQFAAQVRALRARHIDVIVVSSGAIGAGRYVLGLKKRPTSLAEKQAAAAVGQARLMRVYKDAFRRVKLPVAQILLTYDDLDSKMRCKNAQNTLGALLHMGVVPIINENDTVAVEEIKFGDNDHLSALTVELVKADLLVLLTDVAGVLDKNGELIRELTVGQARAAIADGVATGGMIPKLETAIAAIEAGVEAVVILDGRRPHAMLVELFTEHGAGTLVRRK